MKKLDRDIRKEAFEKISNLACKTKTRWIVC